MLRVYALHVFFLCFHAQHVSVHDVSLHDAIVCCFPMANRPCPCRHVVELFGIDQDATLDLLVAHWHDVPAAAVVPVLQVCRYKARQRGRVVGCGTQLHLVTE